MSRNGDESTGQEPVAGASETPDPRYVVDLNAPAGMLAAAERFQDRIERLSDGSVRIGAATVRRTSHGLACDCPAAASSPAGAVCLHRLVASRWARGLTAGTPSGSARAADTDRFSGAGEHRSEPAGESLPAEDLARFEPLLTRVDALVADLLAWGLDRATPAMVERVASLRMAAEAMGVRPGAPRQAGLGRLSSVLNRLETQLGEFVRRVVTTTEMDILSDLAVAHNLLRAIRANTAALPLRDFAGAPHRDYVPAPPLDVQGLGLEAWTTPDGYAGVTAYVADLRTGRILTRTAALPTGRAAEHASADWAAELAQGPSFAKSPRTLRDLASHRFMLSGALVAPDSGRLSGSRETALAERPRLSPGHPRLRAFMLLGRGDAIRIARRLAFDPLGRPPHSPPVALLPVLSMTPSDFDHATQQLSFQVTLPGGAPLGSSITFRKHRDDWLDNLETLTRASPPPRFLFVRLCLEGGTLQIEPLTAYFRDEAPWQLTLG